uniref:Uncharacterized protein n=1 Tax=Avena sativa TaxID=4498 RepID=A0ACD5URV1_AVESA
MPLSLALRRLSSCLRRPVSGQSGHLRQLLSTAASRPLWAMFDRVSLAFQSEQPLEMTATSEFAEPPGYSHLLMPAHYIVTAEDPHPCRYSGVEQILCGAGEEQILCGVLTSSSGDGLLVLAYADLRASPPIIAPLLGKQVPGPAQTQTTGEPVSGRVSDFTYLVCNPVSGQVFRVPDSGGLTDILGMPRMGILTQADRGRGPPDRFAVAQLLMGSSLVRFLSDTREWDLVKGVPSRRMWTTDQEVLAFGGRLWWVDVSCGAISADPFSDRARDTLRRASQGQRAA